jgi:hypothetical protein
VRWRVTGRRKWFWHSVRDSFKPYLHERLADGVRTVANLAHLD